MDSGSHKLSIDITDKQFARLQRLFSHGMRKAVFSILIDDLCDLIEQNGELVLGALLTKSISLRNYGTLKDLSDAEDRKPKN